MVMDELKTPCYIINESIYRKNISELMSCFEALWPGKMIYGYSVKTNHLPYLIRIASEYGWKTEVVSPDEYELAKHIGSPDENIIYNGPQKRNTVVDAIKSGAIVNLDNLMEVKKVCDHASDFDLAHTRIGLRVNFNLEELCPGETTCSETVGRFGICLENGDLRRAIQMLEQCGLTISGLHMHSSSRSRSIKIFKTIAVKAVEIIRNYNLSDLKFIDIGGGFFGGNYFKGKPSIQEYANTICSEIMDGLGMNRCKSLALILEPGAAILATAMDYLTSVLNIREIRGERIVTVDGTILHINPRMNPHETPCTLIAPGPDTDIKQIVGGSTCMEMDRIYPGGLHQLLEMKTKLLFHACGAYMSTHNSSFINAVPSIYVLKEDNYSVIREKILESMIKF